MGDSMIEKINEKLWTESKQGLNDSYKEDIE